LLRDYLAEGGGPPEVLTQAREALAQFEARLNQPL
jgi:hypothetical protein